ncbi:MAG: hypothetical protein HOO06_00200 [Bdellovibrionaceae bacterium]|jgi:hypothetical protein|nr:hypothetical protein [Pseudobdellovibrionaceae bacterium]
MNYKLINFTLALLTTFMMLGKINAAQRCGYVNKVIIENEFWHDVRVVLYNKEWSEKYITVINDDFTHKLAQIIVSKTKDFSEQRELNFQSEFNWYYKNMVSKLRVCMNSTDPKLQARENESRYYIHGHVDLLNVQIDSKSYDAKKLLLSIKMNSNKDQLLCMGFTDYPNLLANNNVQSCGVEDTMCYTGNARSTVRGIWSSNFLIIDDEYQLDNIVIRGDQIQVEIFDYIAYENEESDESNREFFVRSFLILPCSQQ